MILILAGAVLWKESGSPTPQLPATHDTLAAIPLLKTPTTPALVKEMNLFLNHGFNGTVSGRLYRPNAKQAILCQPDACAASQIGKSLILYVHGPQPLARIKARMLKEYH